jgi:hypothetical protein
VNLDHLSDADYWETLSAALAEPNYSDLERLRGRRVRAVLDRLAALYARTDDRTRDAIVFLAQDHMDERLRPVMRSALGSADAGTRTIALCHLYRDWSVIDRVRTPAGIDPAKVEAMATGYLRSGV